MACCVALLSACGGSGDDDRAGDTRSGLRGDLRFSEQTRAEWAQWCAWFVPNGPTPGEYDCDGDTVVVPDATVDDCAALYDEADDEIRNSTCTVSEVEQCVSDAGGEFVCLADAPPNCLRLLGCLSL